MDNRSFMGGQATPGPGPPWPVSGHHGDPGLPGGGGNEGEFQTMPGKAGRAAGHGGPHMHGRKSQAGKAAWPVTPDLARPGLPSKAGQDWPQGSKTGPAAPAVSRRMRLRKPIF